MRLARSAFVALVGLGAACAAGPPRFTLPPLALANDNRLMAGTGNGRMRSVRLVAAAARWAPDGDTSHTLAIEAIGEAGGAPSVPAPLVRVMVGDSIRVSVRNTLADTLVLCGLARGWCAGRDTLRLAPGATTTAVVPARAPGTYLYWGGVVRGGKVRKHGTGGQLVGAYVVDSVRTAAHDDRILVMTGWNGARPVKAGSDTPFVMGINGRTWPNTERLDYAVGDTVRWRVISATGVDHPMHLHGTYFRVDARGGPDADTLYAPDQRRWVITENLPPMTSMAVTWVPARGGQWLFHCHRAVHMSGEQLLHLAGQPSLPMHDMGRLDHAHAGMAGLVMGITVRGGAPTPTATRPARRMRLLVQRQPGHYGSVPGFGYVLQDGVNPPRADSVRIPGPTLVLTRDEPVEITVVNRLDKGTAVHWHGIELDSYYDGVPDFSGDEHAEHAANAEAHQAGTVSTTPMIAPNDSFVVRFTPPRSGTFIYHTHANEQYQLSSGLYGALVIVDDARRWDPSTDHVMLLGQDGPSDSGAVVLNGSVHPKPVALRAGVRHRFRFINMTPQDMADVTLRAGTTAVRWTARAKDGADLPAGQRMTRAAQFTFGPGETYDFELVPTAGQTTRLTVKSFNDIVALFRAR